MNFLPALALTVLVVSVGCKHSDPGAAVTAPHQERSSVSRAGWVDVSSSGFTISLPTEMQVKDLSQADVNKMMDRAHEKRPGEEKVQNALRKDAAKGDLKLVATLKHAGPTGFHNALAVLVKANTGNKTDDELLNSNQRALEKISIPGTVVGKKVTLPSGPGICIQSSRQRTGSASTAATSYLIIHGRDIFVFSFVSQLADKDPWRATAQSVMESLKFDH